MNRNENKMQMAHAGILKTVAAAAAVTILAGTSSAQAAAYWNTGDGVWNTGGNWSSNNTSGGTTGTLPSSSNAAVLNQSSVNGNEAVTFTADGAASGVTFNNTGTTSLSSDSGTARSLSIGSGGITIASSAGAVTIGGAASPLNVALTADQIWTNSSTNALIVQNVVSGSGKITKSGAGVLTLAGANTYGGGTTFGSTGGTLNINNGGSSGTSSAIGTGALTIGNGATIDNTSGNSVTLSTNNAVTFSTFAFGGGSDLTFGNGAVSNVNSGSIVTLNGTNRTLTFGGTVTDTATAGNITLTVNGAGNTLVLGGYNISNGGTPKNLFVSGTGNVAINGTVADNTSPTAASALTYNGSGVLTLAGSNTYTGKTTVSGGGTIQFARRTALYGGNTGSWTGSNVNVASGATLALNVGGGNDFTAGDVNTLLSNISNASASSVGLQGGAKLAFDTTNASAGGFTQGNAIADSTGSKGGKIGVTKLGTNALIFDKANTYTGDTKIVAGSLRLGGSDRIADTSAVELAGGTLDTAGFSETVAGLTLSGTSAIDLGDGASVLHFSDSHSLAWTGGAVLSILNWSGSTTDQLFVGTSLAGLTGDQLAQIQFLNPAGAANGSYGATILSTGELVPSVPEPASMAFLACGVAGVLMRRRVATRCV